MRILRGTLYWLLILAIAFAILLVVVGYMESRDGSEIDVGVAALGNDG